MVEVLLPADQLVADARMKGRPEWQRDPDSMTWRSPWKWSMTPPPPRRASASSSPSCSGHSAREPEGESINPKPYPWLMDRLQTGQFRAARWLCQSAREFLIAGACANRTARAQAEGRRQGRARRTTP